MEGANYKQTRNFQYIKVGLFFFWLCWVFFDAWVYSSCDTQAPHCSSFSLQNTGSRVHIGFSRWRIWAKQMQVPSSRAQAQ